HALAEPAGDDLEPGPVQGTRRRRELRQHVRTLLAFLDHPDHAADLALCPAQPPDHVRELLAVHVHGRHAIPLGVWAHRIPRRTLDRDTGTPGHRKAGVTGETGDIGRRTA